MTGHVESVTVHRCGDYASNGGCGNEYDCRRCDEWWDGVSPSAAEIIRSLAPQATPGQVTRWSINKRWPKDLPKPTTTISHQQFINEYNRCPRSCVVAKQLALL